MALAPVLICLLYLYIRDKYEKEPVKLLLTGIIYGVVITFPIIQCETFMTALTPIGGRLSEAFFASFCVASLVEEAMKFIVLFFLTWRNDNLNERFDGIVYSAFIALGFAGFENVLYVLNPDLGGMNTALMRALISVPGHAFFGVTMGYYFAMAKLEREKRGTHILKAFIVTYVVHGLFDFILLSGALYTMPIFVAFLIYLWVNGFRKIKKHVEASPFKKTHREYR